MVAVGKMGKGPGSSHEIGSPDGFIQIATNVVADEVVKRSD